MARRKSQRVAQTESRTPMSDIEEELKKHLDPIVAEGYSLNPPGYERLNLWTHVLFQLHYAATEFSFLTTEKPKLYDATNFHEHYSRFCAAIVAYGRCFAEAGAGIVSLDAKDVFKPRPKLRAVHDRMIVIRNGVFAHAGHDEILRMTIAVKEEKDRINFRHLTHPVLPFRIFNGRRFRQQSCHKTNQ